MKTTGTNPQTLFSDVYVSSLVPALEEEEEEEEEAEEEESLFRADAVN